MANGVEVNPERIAKHGEDISKNLIPALEKVAKTIDADNIGNLEGGSFSITLTAAAMAYPGAVQWVFEDIRTHLKMLEEFAKGIETTAKNYGGAESASTIRCV